MNKTRQTVSKKITIVMKHVYLYSLGTEISIICQHYTNFKTLNANIVPAQLP